MTRRQRAIDRLARSTSPALLRQDLARAELCVADGCVLCAREVEDYRAALVLQAAITAPAFPRGTSQKSETLLRPLADFSEA